MTEMQSKRERSGALLIVKTLGITLVLGLGIWQFARAGFNWREVLVMTDPLLFFFAMASLPVLGFPISACYIYAGLAFMPLQASVVCIGALSVNMSVSYALTHSVFKQPILRFLESRGWSIPKLSKENQFRFTFLMRTVPGPPFFFQNLLLSLAGIPFLTYLWVSLLTQGGIAVAVIFCSRSLSNGHLERGEVIALVVIGAFIAAKGLRSLREWYLKRNAMPR
jgi:uncharacterized membrane protein YdjX (TVP38/TMEM64 family)